MDILGVLGFGLSVLIGLLILVVLVVVHELGHAIVARRNGVVVEEFGIGFPPRAWEKKLKNGVLLTINWLPIGGFVKLQGEHDAADKKGDYGHASLWSKTKILLAGVVMNWLVAAVLLTVLAVTGLPKLIPNQFMVASDTSIDAQPAQVATVTDGLPAATAGVQKGDTLISFAGEPLSDATKLADLAKENSGKTVPLVYQRDGVEQTAYVKIRSSNDDKKGYLGLASSQRTMYRSTWSAPVVGVALTGQLTAYTLESLGTMLVKFVTGIIQKISFSSETREEGSANLNAVSANVGGPIAILGVLFPAAVADGPSSLVLAAALISLTLAVMNLLPIPALDGGRWFVTMLYRVVLRRPLTKEKEEAIHGTGFMVLLGLILLVTIADIGKLFG